MIPTTVPDAFRDLYGRIADIERRVANRRRTGLIAEVDPVKGLARVKLGTDKKTGKPYLSPWMPWKELAHGSIKTFFPPAVGEQVDVVSMSGDIADGYIDTSLPSNQNLRPHDKLAEGVITVGNMRLLIKNGQTKITVGNATVDVTTDSIKLTCAGGITLDGPLTFKGNITHTGNMNTSGVHVDANGDHKAEGGGGGGAGGGGGDPPEPDPHAT